MSGRQYEAPKSINCSIGSERYEWVDARAKKYEKTSNKSAVMGKAVDCYKEVLEQFGENWKDQLKVQSKPQWVTAILTLLEELSRKQSKLLELITNSSISPERKAELIEKIEAEMDVEGMVL